MSKRPAKRWTVDETKAFLIFYRARKQEMENHRKKRMAYAHILEDTLAAGFDPNIEVSLLEVKMATLMRSYKASKDNAKRTGASPCTAPFMEEMDDLFGDKPITTESEAFNVGVEYLFEDFEADTSWPSTPNTPADPLLPFESTDSADTLSTSRSAVVHQAKRAKITRSEYLKKDWSRRNVQAKKVTNYSSIVIVSNDPGLEQKLTDVLFQQFKMKDMGEISSVLGVRITRNRKTGTISLDRTQYIKDILSRFNMSDFNPTVAPMDINQKISAKVCPSNDDERNQMKHISYRQLVGALQFCVQVSRPDIRFPVNVLSRYSNNPGGAHWGAAKRILRYLKGTIDKKITYNNSQTLLKGYCDADWASDEDERRSTTGVRFRDDGKPSQSQQERRNLCL